MTSLLLAYGDAKDAPISSGDSNGTAPSTGLLSAFGSFQAYYETELLPTNSAFEVSTIGSLQAQGLCIGVGYGTLVVLSVAIPARWFTTRLPVVNGVAGIGSGLGG